MSVTHEQKAAIRAAAKRKGLNPSSWGRMLFLEQPEVQEQLERRAGAA